MRNTGLVAPIVLIALLSAPAGAAPPDRPAPPIPRGTEIRVSTNPQVSSFNPAVAVFPDGGFVVVWRSAAGVRARFFDRRGRPISGERALQTGGHVHEILQIVAERNDGFTVVWTGSTAARPEMEVYVRRFRRNGTPKAQPVRANIPNFPEDDVFGFLAAIGPEGRLAVAWRERILVNAGTPEESVYTNARARIFSARGRPLTPQLLLAEGEASDGINGSISDYPTALGFAPDGTLNVQVQLRFEDVQNRFLVRVPPDGGPLVRQGLDPFFFGFPDDSGASLAVGRDGSLVATWSNFLIQAQRLAPDGTLRGEPFEVTDGGTGVDHQIDPAVALQAGGSFVVVWTEEEGRDGDGRGIYGRAFAANGTPRTQDFRVNTTTVGDQLRPRIAAARQGPMVVVWTQSVPGRADVFARVISAEP